MRLAPALLAAAALIASPNAAAGATDAPVPSNDPDRLALIENVPVPGGIAALSRSLEIEPIDPARVVSELARLLYSESREKTLADNSPHQRLVAHLHSVANRRGAAEINDVVPIALPARVWSDAVFRRPIPATELFAAVLTDRAAALVARGLAALDDETLSYFAKHSEVLRALHEDSPGAFAAFAAHLRIRNSRVEPPGGAPAIPLWEALLRENVTRPDRFIPALFAKSEGRLAYLYEALGSLDEPRQLFALGGARDGTGRQVDRFNRLASFATSSFPEWKVSRFPFKRPAHDLQMMLVAVEVDSRGQPAYQSSRWFWTRLFHSTKASDRGNQDDESIDAAGFADLLLTLDARVRAERLERFVFAQRLLAEGFSATGDLFDLVPAFPRFRMLMLTLDRIGVRNAAIYGQLTRRADEIAALDARRARSALAQLQSAIGLIAELASVRRIDRAAAERLLATLAAVAIDPERGYAGGVASWLQAQLLPALRIDADMDSGLIEALAGRSAVDRSSRIDWEGQRYRFDLAASEARRLRHILGDENAHAIQRALDAFSVGRQTGPLSEVAVERAEAALADALLVLTYAIHWPAPSISARAVRALALRHDFGLSREKREARARMAWAEPSRAGVNGEPWYVAGSVLGLELVVAPLALRRVGLNPPTSEPPLSGAQRDVFVKSLAILNPHALSDATRDAIADAIAKGRRRVAALAADGTALETIAREIALDGWRLRALQWSLQTGAAPAASFFSLGELLSLGGGTAEDLHEWGMSGFGSAACICTRLAPPGRWIVLTGRLHMGILATAVPDLHLRVAEWLSEARLPAALAKTVLTAAVQDLVERVTPSDSDDWLTLVRTAQNVSRERLEDYVSIATVDGPLVLESSQGERQ